jgi:hypothetical protein
LRTVLKLARALLVLLAAGVATAMVCYWVTGLAMSALLEKGGDDPFVVLMTSVVMAAPASFVIGVRAAVYAYRGGAAGGDASGTRLPASRRWRARAFSIPASLAVGVVILLVLFPVMSSGPNDPSALLVALPVATLLAMLAEDRLYRFLLAQERHASGADSNR